MAKKTTTSSFGTSKREAHDASGFYNRNMYSGMPPLLVNLPRSGPDQVQSVPDRPLQEWADQVYCHTSEQMVHVPDNSVALAFTSPPYNVGKDFDQNLDLDAYFALISQVASEVYRVLKPGGRFLVNIANLGRKPYIPMHAYFYALHMAAGFLPAGEIIWRKSKGMNGNCAWGTWRSAKRPVLRDLHEYILVFAKEHFGRAEVGESTISGEEFMEATLSVWDIPPASAKKVGHPAPFPVELAERAVRLFTYRGDVVLDPFNGSGATCVAALKNDRHYVGYDLMPGYCDLAKKYIAAVEGDHVCPAPEQNVLNSL